MTQHADRGSRLVAMLVRNPYTHDSRVEKEAATLRAAGYRVVVVADAAPDLAEHDQRGGVDVHRVPRRGPRLPGLSFALHEWRLSQLLAKLRPDILHAHDSNALLPVAVAARRLRRPFIYDAHDLWLHRPRRQRSHLYHALQNAYYAVVERLLVRRAAAAITVSPPIARHLERKYRLDLVHLVPNYPDRPGNVIRREIRDLLGLDGVSAATPVVLYLGGLMGGRGIEFLVRAMPSVPTAHLVMLGSGHQARWLADEARRIGVIDRVHVLSPVPPEQVVGYAMSATIGVSPIVPSCLNYRYSLPNKLFQYMAAGLAVVASDFPQVREIVTGADAGLVVDTSRQEAIAGALNQLLAEPEKAARMGEQGHRAVMEHYHWGKAADTLREVYARASL